MFHEGDIVEIPLPDSRTAIGWIIHISEHLRMPLASSFLGSKGIFVKMFLLIRRLEIHRR